MNIKTSSIPSLDSVNTIEKNVFNGNAGVDVITLFIEDHTTKLLFKDYIH